MLQEWMPIEEFPEYSVSNDGYVVNNATGRILSNSTVQYNMRTVAFSIGGEQHRRSVAVLVARAFLPEPPRDDFNTIIHLDGDRANCRSDNLAWRPRWFAINYHMERHKKPYRNFHEDIRIVETWEVFDTLSEPAMKYGLLERDIHRSLFEQTRVYPVGYTFMFLNL